MRRQLYLLVSLTWGTVYFLSASNRYSDIILLQKYVNQYDDIEKEFELLGLCYGVLINPIFETATTNILWLANKCLDMMGDLIEKCSINKSISNEYRIIRLRWIRSFIYMMNGNYLEALNQMHHYIDCEDEDSIDVKGSKKSLHTQ